MREVAALVLILAVASIAPVPAAGDTHELLLINGVPSEHLITEFRGEEGVIEADPEGRLVAAAVGSSIAVVDALTDTLTGVVNLSRFGWGRTVSLAWAGGRVVVVNDSCSVAVIGLGDGGPGVELLTGLGRGLRASEAGGIGAEALVLCSGVSGPVMGVLNVGSGEHRLIRLRGLVSVGNPIFGRGPLADTVSGRVYFSGIAPSGDSFVHGIYYLTLSELLSDEASPHLLYGIGSTSDWYLVGVRDVKDGVVLADVNGGLLLINGDGETAASVNMPWFYGDAVFYRSTREIALTFRERYDVEWVAIYDTVSGLVEGLFMRGSVLRLATASGKIYVLEPCVPGRDDYIGLYSIAYRGLNDLVSAGVRAEVSGASIRFDLVNELAPGGLHSWVSAYLDLGSWWWETVYTTHIHYNGSLYNTVLALGVGGTGRAYVIDDLVRGASPIPGAGVVMAGPLVAPPSYPRLRQWYLIDAGSGKAVTVLEVGADEVRGVQALSPSEWVAYGGDAVRLYTVSGASAFSKVVGAGVSLASPVQGTDYVAYVRGPRLLIGEVGAGGLSALHSASAEGLLGAAYNPVEDSVLLVTARGASVVAADTRTGWCGRAEDLLWPPSLTPIAPAGDGAVALKVGDGQEAIVLASAMGRVRVLADATSCSNPTPIGYFVSSGAVGVAIGCSSGAIIAWTGAGSALTTDHRVAWAGVASAAYLILLSALRLGGLRPGGSKR